MIYLSSLLVTFILSYATITWLIMPVLTRYESLTRLINHFDFNTLINADYLVVWHPVSPQTFFSYLSLSCFQCVFITVIHGAFY